MIQSKYNQNERLKIQKNYSEEGAKEITNEGMGNKEVRKQVIALTVLGYWNS